MSFQFEVKKVAQAVAFLIKRTGQDRMNVMKLLKLLYIADRESLKEVGRPITGDQPVAMPHGPVLSQLYDLIKGRRDWPYNNQDETFWRDHFETVGRDLRLLKHLGTGEMSPYELRKLEEVIEEHGAKGPFKLRDLTHTFPEWRDNNPGNSSRRIPLADILKAVGRSKDAAKILRARSEEEYFDRLFAGNC